MYNKNNQLYFIRNQLSSIEGRDSHNSNQVLRIGQANASVQTSFASGIVAKASHYYRYSSFYYDYNQWLLCKWLIGRGCDDIGDLAPNIANCRVSNNRRSFVNANDPYLTGTSLALLSFPCSDSVEIIPSCLRFAFYISIYDSYSYRYRYRFSPSHLRVTINHEW